MVVSSCVCECVGGVVTAAAAWSCRLAGVAPPLANGGRLHGCLLHLRTSSHGQVLAVGCAGQGQQLGAARVPSRGVWQPTQGGPNPRAAQRGPARLSAHLSILLRGPLLRPVPADVQVVAHIRVLRIVRKIHHRACGRRGRRGLGPCGRPRGGGAAESTATAAAASRVSKPRECVALAAAPTPAPSAKPRNCWAAMGSVIVRTGSGLCKGGSGTRRRRSEAGRVRVWAGRRLLTARDLRGRTARGQRKRAHGGGCKTVEPQPFTGLQHAQQFWSYMHDEAGAVGGGWSWAYA